MSAGAGQIGFRRTEKDQIVSDAAVYLGCTPAERWAAFVSIQRMVAATWAGLDPEEMWRRLRIGEALEPRPDPWWANFRREAQP